MTKVFKTAAIALMVLMSATATFAQTSDNNGLHASTPGFIWLDVNVYVPTPTWVGEVVEKVTVTITWHDSYGSGPTLTKQGEPDSFNPLKWSCEFGVHNNDDYTHVTYKVVASNGVGTIGWIAEGSSSVTEGQLNITEWQLKWQPDGNSNDD